MEKPKITRVGLFCFRYLAGGKPAGSCFGLCSLHESKQKVPQGMYLAKIDAGPDRILCGECAIDNQRIARTPGITKARATRNRRRTMWTVEEMPKKAFESGGAMVRVFQVHGSKPGTGMPVNVWLPPSGTIRCVNCSGPLVAMRMNCPHALAVKRKVLHDKQTDSH